MQKNLGGAGDELDKRFQDIVVEEESFFSWPYGVKVQFQQLEFLEVNQFAAF